LKKINLNNSKGISVIFLIIAMLLMVTIGYVFSYLIPTKQKSVVFPIQSTQAFFLAQSGVEFAVRYAKDQGWTTTAQLAGLTGMTRTFGAGSFTLTYTNTAPNLDTLTSVGQVPIGTARRSVKVSNFTTFLSYFAYRRSITVQAGQVTGTLTNFPMLISVTNANLATVANGGHIASYNPGTNDPQDLVFEALDDATCGGAGTSPCRLDHEIEAYVPATGQLVAWVRVPSITNGTVIYMYYGNGCSVSTQNAMGVWDANYRGVWHLSQNPTGAAPQMRDSTTNAYNGTAVGSFVAGDQQAAVIDGGLNFNGTNDEIQIAKAALGATSVTVSAWIRVKSFSESTFSPNANTTVGAVFFSTRDLDGDVSPTLGVSPVSGGAGAQNGLVFINDSANIAMGAKGATDIALNMYYYAVGTFSYSGAGNFAGNWNVYLNGALNGGPNNFNLAGNATGNFTGASWRLANNPQWPGYSNVILDEVRVSNIARSAGWIATEYRNQNAPATFYTVGAEQNN
jgi:biopolymer transport protein ExbB